MNYIDHERFVRDIFYSALRAVDPYKLVETYVKKIDTAFRNGSFKSLLSIGFGKAAYPMMRALQDDSAYSIDKGIVITKYGHSPISYESERIKVIEGGHPIPDKKGFLATEEIIELLRDADERTLVICLISGGGSALLVSPYQNITLGEKQRVTELLLRAGANISELNAVRKHISKVKGGRLAEIACPARVISLILSDVPGDRLDVVASGPTSPDNTTFQDALGVMKKYRLMDRSPQSVIDILTRGVNNLISETPKKDNSVFEKVENIVIGNNKKAICAAQDEAKKLGLDTIIMSAEIQGEAKDAGRWLARKTADMKKSKESTHPTCLISGGETTVTVKGNGLGGRNMELALSFAMEIEGIGGITLLSAGTDGTDGPTDAAGAIVDGNTLEEARTFGIDPLEYLRNNDSYNFFKKIGELFITGPTGTNVMDIQIILME
jgi:glycerate 2-kinase